MRKLRGKEIGFIFQDPLTSLNPTLTIGYQIGEAIREHMGLSSKAAKDRIVELLAKVGIPRPADRLNDYPFQFSGGMRQRVMIAIALSCDPKLILADEPTTALDVTIQAQILELIQRLSSRVRDGRPADHPRPRDRRRACATGSTSCTPGGSSRPAPVDDAVREPADAVRVGPARLAAAHRRRPGRPAADDRGPAAAADRPARRLPLRPRCAVHPRHLPRAGAGAHRRGTSRTTSPAAGRPSPAGGSHDRHRDARPAAAPRRRRTTRPTSSRSTTSRSTSRSGPGIFKTRQGRGQGGRRRDLRGPPRRDARAGRRVGLRQEHDRPGDDPAARRDRRDASGSTASTCSLSRPTSCAGCAAGCRSSSRTRTARSTRG